MIAKSSELNLERDEVDRALGLRAAGGDREAEAEVVRRMLPVVRVLAHRATTAYPHRFDEFLGEGRLWLVEAVRQFKGGTLGPWVGWFVGRRLVDYARRSNAAGFGGMSTVSRKAGRERNAAIMKDPAACPHCRRAASAAMRAHGQPADVDGLANVLHAKPQFDGHHLVARDGAWAILSRIAPRLAAILKMRAGVPMSTAEIARLLGVTDSRGHQLVTEALREARAVGIKLGLEDEE